MINRLLSSIVLIIFLVACSPQSQQPKVQSTNTPVPVTYTSTESPTPTFTPTSTITLTPTITPVPIPSLGSDATVVALTFSPNGEILSVLTTAGVYLFQATTMEFLSFLPSKNVLTALVFIDDKTLATGDQRGLITVWNIYEHSEVIDSLQRIDPIVGLGTSVNKSILVVQVVSQKISIVSWEPGRPEIVYPITTAIHAPYARYSQAKNFFVVTVNAGGKVILIDTKRMKTIAVLCHACMFSAVSPSGNFIASSRCCRSGNSSRYVVFEAASQKEIIEFADRAFVLDFSPDEKWLIFEADAGLSLWSVETNELVRRFDGEHADKAAFSPDGSLLVSVEKNILSVIDISSGDILFTLSL